MAGLTAKLVASPRVHWPGNPRVRESGKLRETRVDSERERADV